MIKALSIVSILFMAFVAQAAERITATITVTNAAGTTNSITINSTFRYWTNANSIGTIQTNLTGKNQTATNLYNQIASYPYPGGVILRWADTNQIQLIGSVGGALAGSIGGTWATLTLATQSGPQTYTALWPMENMVGATNRTNQGSALVAGLSTYSTNAFATNSTANSNFLTKGASQVQTAISPFLFTGRIGIGGSLNATNGFTSGLTNINPVNSNLVNYGNAIRSESTGGNSLAVGSNAAANALRGMAIGNSSYANGQDAVAIGTQSGATNQDSLAIGNLSLAWQQRAIAIGRGAEAKTNEAMAIGYGAIADGFQSIGIGEAVFATGEGSISIGTEPQALKMRDIAIGYAAFVNAGKAVAIGDGATVTHSNSVAIGYGATSTTTNQIRLGTSAESISVPGIYDSPVSTNSTLRGTNVINGRFDFTSRANTALANGYNSGTVLGTNVYIKLSGPSAAHTNVGFAAAVEGTWHKVQIDNPGLSYTVLSESGLEATPANRILTGTGALVNSTNNPAMMELIYDATAARWRLIQIR